jgi:Na+/H+ antiporter NhaD/arsenite permease-like protein
MFIDFHLLTKIEIIKTISNDLISQIGVFNFSILLSQIISNVPATIFLSKFSNDWYSISYGVNLAGNGFIISSLANFIALRLSNTKNLFFEFHKYSFLFLAITYALTCIWLFIIKS